MRLSAPQLQALKNALEGVAGRVYLYGSRTDHARRGGDIDVLIFSDADPYRLSADVRLRYQMECDEKIDVLVVDPNRIDAEQRAFLNLIETDMLPIDRELLPMNSMHEHDSSADTTTDQRRLTASAATKVSKAVALVSASLAKLPTYHEDRDYTADEREPYDALTDRFVRAVEVCLQFFRSFERLQFGEESLTLRDRLNRMERLGLIDSVELWIGMRDVRNRAVHGYLPDQLKRMYDDIMGTFGPELARCSGKVRQTFSADR